MHVSAREAARRAGLSDGRWRQVVTGVQTKGGTTVPVRPTPRTVVAMALAVEVDPAVALDAAGLSVSEAALSAMVTGIRATRAGAAPVQPPGHDELADEIERIQALPVPAATRLKMLRALIALQTEAAEEREGIEQATG